jgi:hypothetical protein
MTIRRNRPPAGQTYRTDPLNESLPTNEDEQREIATEGGKDAHRLRMPRDEAVRGLGKPTSQRPGP